MNMYFEIGGFLPERGRFIQEILEKEGSVRSRTWVDLQGRPVHLAGRLERPDLPEWNYAGGLRWKHRLERKVFKANGGKLLPVFDFELLC